MGRRGKSERERIRQVRDRLAELDELERLEIEDWVRDREDRNRKPSAEVLKLLAGKPETRKRPR